MFKVGNIVEVINQTLQFAGAFGEVTETKKRAKTGHTIKVKICYAFGYMSGSFFEQEREQWYKPEELVKQDDYPLPIKADMLFKGTWHRLQSRQDPFNPDNNCQYQDCSQGATKRCMINVWGTVSEVDLCQEHAEEFHGTCLERFSWKQTA